MANSRSETITRRIRTIPTVFGVSVLYLLLLPVLLPAAVLVDLTRWFGHRRPWMTTRLLGFGGIYLAAEVLGVLSMGAIWAGTAGGLMRRPFIDGTFRVQRWWTGMLMRGVQAIFGIRFEVEGSDVVTPGPILVLARHASIVDNLIPGTFVAAKHDIRLRYILKQELLSDPCLDIGGNRLPNYFVDRDAENPRLELEQIRALARDLTRRDGVLIFPEGTRFTPKRRSQALDKLRTSNSNLVEKAERLRHVMPPKLGGVSTLLSAEPAADIVFLAHRGLEGFARLGDLWRGAMVGRVVHVKFWRVPSSDVPTGRSARAEWLFDHWAHVDDWVGAADGVAS